MARYAVLIYGEENLTPGPDQGMSDAYNAYGELLTSRGAMAGGEALHPSSTATTIRVADGKTLTTDGPFMETKEVLGGFYLIDAPDLDTAIELASACPGAQVGAVEVRPCVDFTAPAPWSTDKA
ncbi:MAG: YciI family protein [Micromonosporaceae bacterium]